MVWSCRDARDASVFPAGVETASSLPGHAALGVVLLDGKACGLAPHCSAGVGLALTDYLSSGNLVLDEVGGWRTLEIDLCGEANPYAPFFGLDREGRSLDPATVQGWRLGIVVDSLAGFGNPAKGSIVFGELAAVGAVLTVMLPTRVASTLHSYASHYNLVEDAPRPPLTRSSGTPGEDFGFFVAITPLSRAGGDAPFAGDRAFKSFAGGTPPLVGYKPNPLIARKPPGIPELPPPPPSS